MGLMAKEHTAEPASKTTNAVFLLKMLRMVDWLIDIVHKFKNKKNYKVNRLSNLLTFI
jgi:hypothetical protein